MNPYKQNDYIGRDKSSSLSFSLQRPLGKGNEHQGAARSKVRLNCWRCQAVGLLFLSRALRYPMRRHHLSSVLCIYFIFLPFPSSVSATYGYLIVKHQMSR